jgi:hypothetical protein
VKKTVVFAVGRCNANRGGDERHQAAFVEIDDETKTSVMQEPATLRTQAEPPSKPGLFRHRYNEIAFVKNEPLRDSRPCRTSSFDLDRT